MSPSPTDKVRFTFVSKVKVYEIWSCEFNFQVAVLNSVEPAVAVSAEKEEFVATSWEGKEKDELLEDFKGKG